MTEPQAAAPLQFDRAEPPADAPAAFVCGRCGRAIGATYFDVNGAVACPTCRTLLDGERSRGGAGRFLSAAGLGLVAAVAGSALYYAVSALTGYEFGLIGIAVGFGVGIAVRKGSKGRGGWRYQTLAMVLTYLAIVSTYVPPLVKEIRRHDAAAAATEKPFAEPPAGGDAAAPADAAPADATPAAASAEAGAPAEPPSAGGLLLALAMLGGIVLALPFLAGFENVMGLAIIAFSLYEAWKLNRAQPFTVSGPLDARLRGASPDGDLGG
jgi:hypothetical protein